MKTKLTLRMDDALIDSAKRYAEDRGTSLSRMVADYFTALANPRPFEEGELGPHTRALLGALKDSGLNESDYRRYLEEKYL
ncbi:MAG: antitoxin [Coriobacteriia bacterium]|nr:antitoxin [Coriobacteriia bacterium]